MQTGIPAHKEKHAALRLRKQAGGVFGKRRNAGVWTVRMCASLFGKKRDGIVHTIVLHADKCVCVLASGVISRSRWLGGGGVAGLSGVRRPPATRRGG